MLFRRKARHNPGIYVELFDTDERTKTRIFDKRDEVSKLQSSAGTLPLYLMANAYLN